MSKIPEITAEVQLRIESLERLRGDAEHYERLAAIHNKESEAVQRLVQETVTSGLEKASKFDRRFQWYSWLLGIATAVPLGVAGNYVYAYLTKTP